MSIIFHVGMGKAGAPEIQRSLDESRDDLSLANIHYLGRWAEFIRAEYHGFSGFQSFLAQSPEQLKDCARILIERIGGDGKFVISNEQYLENIERLRPFFETLALSVPLRAIIYVNPPSEWLPIAYAQWGVSHKTNKGPVQSFGTVARRLFGQYNYVMRWREVLGDAVMVRKFVAGMDVGSDFGHAIGIAIKPSGKAGQDRLPQAEMVLRAAFNNRFSDMALPDEFNRAMPSLYSPFPSALSGKLNHLFDQTEIPKIIEENAETISYLEREFDLDLSETKMAPMPDRDTVMDNVVGHLIDIVCGNAVQIRELEERVFALAARKLGP